MTDGSKVDSERTSKPPKSSSEVCHSLGFQRKFGEAPSAHTRTFEKRVGSFESPRGRIERMQVIVVEDIDQGRYERSSLGVGLRSSGGPSDWETLVDLRKASELAGLKEEYDGLPVTIDPSLGILKDSLRKGGYQEILSLIEKIRDEGVFVWQLKMLEEEFLFASELFSRLKVVVDGHLPGLAKVEDHLLKDKTIYFLEDLAQRPRVVEVMISGGKKLWIKVGKGRMDQGELDICHLRKHGHLYLITPSDSDDNSWHFKALDREEAEQAFRQAIPQVQERLAGI